MICWTPTCNRPVYTLVWDADEPEVKLAVCAICADNAVQYGGEGVRRGKDEDTSWQNHTSVQHVRWAKDNSSFAYWDRHPSCWASMDGVKGEFSCQNDGHGLLGLCEKHERDIIGESNDKDHPVLRTPCQYCSWDVEREKG